MIAATASTTVIAVAYVICAHHRSSIDAGRARSRPGRLFTVDRSDRSPVREAQQPPRS
jgi:hypothetical protein